jgi:hypothetical protein
VGAANAHEMESNIRDFDIDIPSQAWESLETAGLINPIKNN